MRTSNATPLAPRALALGRQMEQLAQGMSLEDSYLVRTISGMHIEDAKRELRDLPLEPFTQRESRTRPAPIRGRPARLLFVRRNKPNLAQVRSLVDSSDVCAELRWVPFRDVQQALETFHPDIVLSGVMDEWGEGLAGVVRHIRTSEAHRNLPIAVLGPYDTELLRDHRVCPEDVDGFALTEIDGVLEAVDLLGMPEPSEGLLTTWNRWRRRRKRRQHAAGKHGA